ncbi:hypothetical protein LCGC14_2118260, partial [marine sediment metagenome]
TDNISHDSQVLPDLLVNAPNGIKKVYGDKGYDTNGCFKVIDDIGADPIIPTRINSNVFREMHKKRKEILMEVRGLGDDELVEPE